MAQTQSDDASWIDQPEQLEPIIESCRSEGTSDRLLSRFYKQLRFARPSGDIISQTGAVQNVPAFVEGFVSAVRQVGYNSFLEVSDGCTAKICQPLRPKVTPVAGKPNIVRQCTLLSRIQDGVMESSKFLQESTMAWEDSYCCPIGAVLFEIDPQVRDIRCHRIAKPEDSIFWHRSEGAQPIHMYLQEPVTKAALRASYPEHADEIKSAQPWWPQHILGVDPPSGKQPDTVKLCRGWRRAIDGQPGRYVVTLGTTVLNGEPSPSGRRKAGVEWPYEFFPFAVFRNRWDDSGFGGIPMGRFIAPHHLAINRLARIAEDSFKSAVPVLLSHADSGTNEISDIPYQIRKWKGSVRPELMPTNPVSEQVLARIEWHQNKCYEIAGVNRGMASGQLPKGVNSGVAIREHIDMGDARMNEYQKRWEAGWTDAGHIVVALANEVKKVKVKSKVNKDLMEELDLSSLTLERGDYRISYGLTSTLAKSAMGLLEDLGELKNIGLIDGVDVAESIGEKVPDIAQIVDRTTAGRRLAAKQVQQAIEDGEIPVPPSATQGQDGLNAIIMLGQQAWCQAMINPERYDEANLATLHRLLKCAQAKLQQPMQVPTPAALQPAQPMAPNAVVAMSGGPAGARVAHNQYEAASMGINPQQTPNQ
jgi:hypothetical protein